MLTKYEMRQNFLSSLPRFWLEWATIFVMVVLVFYFVSLELNYEKYFVILGVFAAAAFRLMPSFSRIISALQRMKFIHPVLKEFNKIALDNSEFILENEQGDEKSFPFQKNIKFENISFYYLEKEKKYLIK